MLASMIARMEGHDYFYYWCSECQEPVVAIRSIDYPVQCSIQCKDIFEAKLFLSYECHDPEADKKINKKTE